jgi:hypothetical protein
MIDTPPLLPATTQSTELMPNAEALAKTSMRLHHSPDASTYPGFKQTCFVYIKWFSERVINCTSF